MLSRGRDPDTGEEFVFFYGHEVLFSQWHPAPFTLAGAPFPTAEHWMMAAKALLFRDVEMLGAILVAPHPREAKALGRKVRNFDDAIWKARSADLVYAGNDAKLAAPERRDVLLATKGATLVEASPRDRIWGIGLGASHPDACRRARWRGQNRLGRVLTELRDDWLAERADARAARALEGLELAWLAR
ncbi:NADAR family protein [Sandaracinus amylolyticus]|nr:NADAR family protein [Sandaracinus amylolyticus]